MTEKHHSSFVVPADHPSLPGHFPGTPVVPGVMLLELVLKAGEDWRRQALNPRGLKQVKFYSPLLPDEQADVVLELGGETLDFRVTRGDQSVAQGSFMLGVPRA